MRLRSKLFYVFLALLLVVASIVDAARGGKVHKKKKKGKGKKSAFDHSFRIWWWDSC